MQFTEEHEQLRRTVQSFVESEINPNADEWERAGIYPAKEVFKKLAELGLLGITKPEKYGGMGLDYSYEIVFGEELGNSFVGGVPMSIGVQTDMATPALARFGSDELCKEFLVPAISGDMVASIAVSEPGAGSDVASIKTHAKKSGDDYIINGSKMWITNSTQADFFCLLANTSEGKVHQNKSLIIVPANTPGLSVGDRLKKLGMRCSDTAPVYLDNVRVPQRYRIGAEGAGFAYQMMQFQEERLFGAVMGIKGFEMAIRETINYTRDRQAFGQSLLDNQTIHFSLAELQTEVECLRSLIYRATEEYIQGKDVTMLASMCKLKSGRLSRSLPDTCLQFWGGMGYIEDTIVNRIYRDSRLTAIGGGADEIMQGIIAKFMGTLPSKKKTK